MPRKSKPKPDQASNTSKTRKSRPETSITSPSAKRRRISHENDSSSNKPESAQAPPQPSELDTSDASALNKTPRLPRLPLPPPPPSVSSTYILLPPQADDTAIREKWDIHTTSLGGAGAKIESKVRQVLTALRPPLPSEKSKEVETGEGESTVDYSDKKHTIVALTARPAAGNKCISVAEIVKRDLLTKGVESLWQYTGCWTRLETFVPPRSKEAQKSLRNSTATTTTDMDGKIDDTMEDEEEPAFETMQVEERKLVRNAVCLVIYLAMQPVPRLKELYGEQVFRPDAKKA
ncbi:putative E3 ubiquitin-protein ligase [Venturia nashicola]|uniref:Putative E3 ubiquitin-protein ligase n=1 Tax=Venturia nashicola TaxID=86259 RepID=A0A4Z1NII8_9PEZI|nr:putative E3 ubiquitin-protein ligase [Venturia nashicola]TLD18881.1 putative E3 ubiquitin-protein ligase [Venturia nashicola]